MGIFLRKVRVAVTPRSWQLRTKLSNGARVAGYNRAGWGGRGVYIYRDRLEPELGALDHLLQPGDTFLDVGANVGVFTMKAAQCVGESGLVIAVEPFVSSAQQILQNTDLNGFNNVRVRNLCMGSATGEAKFYMNESHPNTFALTQIGNSQALSVLLVSLDELAAWERLERLDYLKIDAEGAEHLIFDGGAKTIAHFEPIIQAEISINSENLMKYLPAGYRSFHAKEELANKEIACDNSLFIPASKLSAIETVLKLGWVETSALAS